MPSHIVGSTMGYEYLAPDSTIIGPLKYKVNLDVCLDCNSSG